MATVDELLTAKRKLAATYLKNGMPGREEHFKQLYNFLSQRLKIQTCSKSRQSKVSIQTHLNKTVFICGVPGTGKTATVAAVLHKLRTDIRDKRQNLHDFEEIQINGQQIPNARKIYSIIMFQLTGERISPLAAQQRLDFWFKNNKDIVLEDDYYNDERKVIEEDDDNDSDDDDDTDDVDDKSDDEENYVDRRRTRSNPTQDNSKKPVPSYESNNRRRTLRSRCKSVATITDTYKIIVVDELDLLFTDKRSQAVFYNLFDWPTTLNSRVIVIAIANTMDFQRFMRGRIESRIGSETLVFGSYSTENLKTILESRLNKDLLNKCFEPVALKIITSRIGKMTGDARRALETCRNAIELALRRKEKKVTANIAHDVGFQSIDDLIEDFIADCHPIALLMLKSILNRVKLYGDEEKTDIDDVINDSNFTLSNVPKDHVYRKILKQIPYDLGIKFLEMLAASDLIVIERNKPSLLAKVYLKDTTEAFKNLVKKQKIV